MRLLFVTQGRFWNWDNASRLRAKSVIEALVSERHKVEVFCLGALSAIDQQNFAKNISGIITLHGVEPDVSMKRSTREILWLFNLMPAVEFVRHVFGQLIKRVIPARVLNSLPARPIWLFNCLRCILDTSPFAGASSQIDRAFVAAIDRFKPDGVYIRCLDAAWVGRTCAQNHIPSVIDAQDVVYLRRDSLIKGGLTNNIYANRKLEHDLLSVSRAVFSIQLEDVQIFREMLPKVHVVHVGQAFVTHRCSRSSTQELVFGFLASEGPPNRAALDELLNSIWPHIRSGSKCPVRLIVAGRISDFVGSPVMGVNVLGVVDDVRDFYDRVDVVLSTMRYGGGLKFKTVEALAHGKAVIATQCGAQGLADHVGAALLRAETTEAIVQRAILLTANRELVAIHKECAFKIAQAHFSADSVYRPMLNAISKLQDR